MLTLDEFYAPNGHRYINVPADIKNLNELGVRDEDAITLIEAEKADEAWKKIRETRSPKLIEIDYKINQAEDVGEDTSNLRAIRQKLRDITTDFDNPEDVIWPI